MIGPAPDYGVRPCCLPTCQRLIPRNQEHPVCRECGIAIAADYLNDATRAGLVRNEYAERVRVLRAEGDRQRIARSQVYYVRIPGDDLVKIGYAASLKERLTGLRVPREALLAVEPGARDVERERHQQFRAFRVNPKREDFWLSPELERWIQSLREQHPLPRWATLPDTHSVTMRRA